MLGGALYGEGPLGIEAGGGAMPDAIGGDWGREAYGLTGGGGEGPGAMLDVKGDVTRGGRAPALGGGGTDGAR